MATTPDTPYRIVWRPLAQADLVGIIDVMALDNPIQAEAFWQDLRDTLLALADHPQRGRRARPGLPAFVGERVLHGNYIAFYRVLDASRAVEVLRVRHTAQRTL